MIQRTTMMMATLLMMMCGCSGQTDTWVNTYGGSSTEGGTFITTTPDGGYILTGSTSSIDGDFKGVNRVLPDILVIKYDSRGDIQWKKTLGGRGDEGGFSIVRTSRGEYVITGFTNANDGDFKGMSKGGLDVFVIKLDSQGKVLWTKIIGGTGDESGSSVTTMSDGGIVLTGLSNSNDGDFEGMNRGDQDIFVVKLDSNGDIIWKKTFGGSGMEGGSSITGIPDGGVFLSGYYSSTDGNFNGMNKGGHDIFVMKLDRDGGILWSKSLGGSGFEQPTSMIMNSDGGCVLTGRSNSDDGDFKGTSKMWKSGGDVFVIRLDSRGGVQWTNTFGGSKRDDGNSITSTTNGGFILAGYTTSDDGDINGTNNGNEDVWVIKLNEHGQKDWEKTFGGTLTDYCLSVSSFLDGGCVLTGFTNSNDGDFKGMNKGNTDLFVMSLDKDGKVKSKGKSSKKK